MPKKRKPRDDMDSELPALVNHKLFKVLSHNIRHRILLVAREGGVSANQVAKALKK